MDAKSKTELLAELTQIKTRIVEINSQYEGQYIDPESPDGQEYSAKMARSKEISKTVAQIEAREQHVRELEGHDDNTDRGALWNTPRPGAVRGADIYDLSTLRGSLADPHGARVELQDRAQRAVEAMRFPQIGAVQQGQRRFGRVASQEDCQEAMAAILAADDKHGTIAKRILVTSNPAYKESFGEWIASKGMQFNAANLSLGVDADGGYAVPVELDPTILPTSDGVVNPLRDIASVTRITGKEWEGVTSAGVTATRRSEGAETTESKPDLAQPTIRTSRVDVWIPFTIELQSSWGGMQGELAKMIQDAKDVEEATAFWSGNGTAPNPEGLSTGATITINTASTATFASVDLDACEEALGPRFQARGQFLANRAIYNLTRHFDSNGGPDLWVRIAEGLAHGGNTGRTLLGYRANELSTMGTTHASADELLVFGDFEYFKIVDRIGLNIELVQHVFGSNQRPTGKRGFFAYWHNSAKVLAAEAFVKLLAL